MLDDMRCAQMFNPSPYIYESLDLESLLLGSDLSD